MIAWYFSAGLLELLGLGIAAFGFRDTWRAHSGGRDFWAPGKVRARRVARRVANAVRRVFGRPVPQQHVTGWGNVAGVAVSVKGRGVVGWGDLPDVEDLRAFAAEVHERINKVHRLAQDNAHAIDDERSGREKADQEIREALESEASRLDEKLSRSAIDGLRLQIWGWGLVLLGVLVGSVANVIEAAG